MTTSNTAETPREHHHVAVRLDSGTLARITALQPHLSGPHAQATRSDVVRALIVVSLANAEKNPDQFAKSRPSMATSNTGESEHVAVRFNGDAINHVTALQSHLATPYAGATRTDVLRALMLVGLADAEKDPAQFAERWRDLQRLAIQRLS